MKIPVAILLLCLLGPLYNVAKDRVALYILLSKSCANIISLFMQTILDHWKLLYAPIAKLAIADRIFHYIYWSLLFAIYLHNPIMAFNRFFAIFFPFNYAHIWNKNNTKRILTLVWIVGILIGCLDEFSFSVLKFYDIDANNLIQIIAGCFCIGSYSLMLLKFAYALMRKRRSNAAAANNNAPIHGNRTGAAASVEKDRILMCAVFALSFMPNLVNVIQNSVFFDCSTLAGAVLIISLTGTCILFQCSEEMCLLLFCKDFRRLVAKQFVRNSAGASFSTNTTTTTAVMEIGPNETLKIHGQQKEKKSEQK